MKITIYPIFTIFICSLSIFRKTPWIIMLKLFKMKEFVVSEGLCQEITICNEKCNKLTKKYKFSRKLCRLWCNFWTVSDNFMGYKFHNVQYWKDKLCSTLFDKNVTHFASKNFNISTFFMQLMCTFSFVLESQSWKTFRNDWTQNPVCNSRTYLQTSVEKRLNIDRRNSKTSNFLIVSDIFSDFYLRFETFGEMKASKRSSQLV